MPTSSVDKFLPRGHLLKRADSASSGDADTSGWREAMEYSSVVGYFIADNGAGAGNATLEIKQSIDKSEADITNSVSPSATGDASPFEFDLVGDYVKVDFEANEDISNLRLIVYRSTRTQSIQ